MSRDKYIEGEGGGKLTLQVREDGRVGVYSPAGFQIVDVEDLPENMAKLVEEHLANE